MKKDLLSSLVDINENKGEEVVRSIVSQMDHLHDVLVEEIRTISMIPAPSFFEEKRAIYVKERFESVGLKNVVIDEFKNVIGRYPGKDSTARLAICSHLDTVFPEETPLEIICDSGRMSCPGIGDNSTSVASLIHLAAAFNDQRLVPSFDILFVGNSCEEGLGDLRGMKGFLDHYAGIREDVDLKAVLALDGFFDRLCHQGVGSRRLRVNIHAEGGHSWESFGNASAIHALGSAIASINDMVFPKEPKTTYNVGVVEGGHSVNSIAENASMLIDIRSVDSVLLTATEKEIRRRIDETMVRFCTSVEYEVVGDRPAGFIPADHPLVKIFLRSAEEMGLEISSHASSTDSNVPLSRGIPAVTFGVYKGGKAHTRDEYIEVETLRRGFPFIASAILKVVAWIALGGEHERNEQVS